MSESIFGDLLTTVVDFGSDYGAAYIDKKFDRTERNTDPVYPTGQGQALDVRQSNLGTISPNINLFGLPLNKNALIIAGGALALAGWFKLMK